MNSADDAAPAVVGGWRRIFLKPWLAGVLAVVCFANTVGNGFVYDDVPLVVKNPRIRDLTELRGLWLSDWWRVVDDVPEGANTHRDRLYRPLVLVTFALNHAVHGYHPLGYHLINVLLHAAVSVLVWLFARRLLDDPTIATIAATLFAVHPVHAEAVANIVGRAELMAALFILIGLLLLQPRQRAAGPGRTLLAALAFLAALLSKETAICYPAIALLTLYATPGSRPQTAGRWLLRVALLLLPLLICLPLRYIALEGTLFRSEPANVLFNPMVVATPAQRALGVFTILGHYTRLLLVPARLCADYGFAIIDPEAGIELMTFVGMLTGVGMLAALVGLCTNRTLWRQMAILTAMFVASYALISNTVLLIGVAAAERLMYWPSAPALILIAAISMALWRRHCTPGQRLAPSARVLRVLGILLVVALALRSGVRNTDWLDNVTLFARDVQAYPLPPEPTLDPNVVYSRGAHINQCLACELVELARRTTSDDDRQALLKLADDYLAAALAVHPPYADALAVRGQVRAELGDVDSACLNLESALRLDPDLRDARRILAQLIHGVDHEERRLDALRRDIQNHPDDPTPRIEIGRILLEYGDPDEALQHLQRAVELAPENLAALRYLARATALAEPGEQAIALYRRVLERDPNDWEAHANLSTLLAESNPAATLRHARRAHELQPGDLRTTGNLAEAYVVNGDVATAIELYRKVEQELEADHPMRPVVHERILRLQRRQ